MGSPYTSHPIYTLRKWTIITSTVGLITNGVFFISPLSVFVFLLSALCCLADLIDWANRKISDPDNEPKWPRKLFIVVDILLALLLQFSFWVSIAILSSWYYFNPLSSYAALLYFISSLLHAYSFWKELMGQKKAAWLTELPPHSCERCGWLNQVDSITRHCPPQRSPPSEGARSRPVQPTAQPNVQPNLFPYAGPSASDSAASYQRVEDILTPEHTESAMEEGLLIGSDVGMSYGSIADSNAADMHPEPELAQPTEIVVGKGKNSKKKGKGKLQERKE